MKTILSAIVAIVVASTAQAQTSSIVSGNTTFSIGSIAGTLKGTFDAPKGKVTFDPENLSATQMDLTIAASSIFTDHKKRDGDAKGEKYLAVEQFPTIRFQSNEVVFKDDMYHATGTLKIKDTSKTTTLPFQAKKNQDGSYTINSTFEINRLDYGVGGKTFMLRNVATVQMDAIIN